MATFAERFSEYLSDMRLERQTMAAILSLSPQAVGTYANGKAAPALKDFPSLARTLGVSNDWLLGEPVATRWGLEIQMLRLWLRTKAPEVVAPDAVERMIKVVHLCQEFSERCQQPWFMAGAMGLELPDYNRFMAGDVEEIDAILPKLAEFTALPDKWFIKGDAAALHDHPADPGDYANALIEFSRHGIQGEDLAQIMPEILQAAAERRQSLGR